MSRSARHRRVGLAGLWLLVMASCALAAASDAGSVSGSGTTSPPPVAVPAGAQRVDESHDNSATYPLIVRSIAQLGGIKGNISATRTIDGALMRRTFTVKNSASAKQAAAALAHALAKAGFKTLYQCQGAACGPEFTLASPGYRANPELFSRAPGHYIAAQRSGDQGDVYVSLQVVPHGQGVALQYDVVRVKPQEVGAISVNAAEMARQIQATGRVVLYGIFFNSDSDRIKSKSRAVLKQVAQLLDNQPKLRLLVVGHTDSTGSFSYNMALSRRRAHSVVSVLVNTEHVARDRLKAVGDGYTAPRASNSSGVGRAKNRRVELVPW